MKKSKRIKKMLAALLAGSLLCSVTSCGKKEDGIQLVKNAETEPEYLSFFSAVLLEGTDLGKYWSDKFVELYHQQVYIDYEGSEYYANEGLSSRELLEKRLESTSPDDMFIISAEDVMAYEKKGYWMDLSEMEFVENLSEAARYQSTYQGKVFSVPLTITGFGFYWNVSLLKEHGLRVPGNREEFMAVCQKLKSKGILPYGANKGYALTVPAMAVGLSKLYGSPDQEARIDALNSGEAQISTYMREGYEFLEEMIEKGYMDPQQALDTVPKKEDLEMFREGRCAFICIDMGVIDEKELDFEQKHTGLPLLEDGSVVVYGAGSRLSVNPASKHLDTVLKFTEMVGTREALDESAAWQRQMSSAKDSQLAIPNSQKKMFDLLLQPGQIPNQDFALYFNTWENIRDRGRELCGGASVEQVCEELDQLQLQELAAYVGED